MKKFISSLSLAVAVAAYAAPGPVTVSTSASFTDQSVLTNVSVALPVGTFNSATFYAPSTTTKNSVGFTWTKPAGGAGYYLYWGDVTSASSNRFDALGNTGALFFTLSTNVTYFLYVTAYDTNKVESVPSNILILKPGT